MKAILIKKHRNVESTIEGKISLQVMTIFLNYCQPGLTALPKCFFILFLLVRFSCQILPSISESNVTNKFVLKGFHSHQHLISTANNISFLFFLFSEATTYGAMAESRKNCEIIKNN